jgi:hypothetical protein
MCCSEGISSSSSVHRDGGDWDGIGGYRVVGGKGRGVRDNEGISSSFRERSLKSVYKSVFEVLYDV